MLSVNFYATLRQVVGAKTVSLELQPGITLRQVLDELLRRYPGLRAELFDAQGQLYGHVHVFINGRDVQYHQTGLATVLTAADQISIFPAVGGGQA